MGGKSERMRWSAQENRKPWPTAELETVVMAHPFSRWVSFFAALDTPMSRGPFGAALNDRFRLFPIKSRRSPSGPEQVIQVSRVKWQSSVYYGNSHQNAAAA